MERLQKAIERTIEYGRRFGVEYTEGEIRERLISKKNYELRITNYELRTNKITKEKLKLAKKLARDLERKFRDILMIGVTGSVAAGYPKKDSDIDLMIITQKNSLWLTRLKLRGYIFLKQVPHRRFGKEEKKDEFCFNLWLEEDCLLIPKERQNIRTAMDLILMKPVLNKDKIYEKFILDNSWAKKYVATGYNRLITNYELRITNYENNIFKKVVNWLVFWPQWFYMKRRLGRGLVNLKQAFFHP